MSQLDLSDSSLLENYARVRAGVIDWYVMGYGGTRNVVSTESTGHGYADLQKALTGPVQYVYARAPKENTYFLAIYTAPDASSLLKAKSAVHKRTLAETLVHHHFMITSTSTSDFDEDALNEKCSSADLQTPPNDLTPEALEAAAAGAPPRPIPPPVAKPAVVKPAAAPAPVEPTPEPTPEPVRAPEPEPEPEPVRAPEPVRQPEPVREPEPVKQPEPVKASTPAAAAAPAPSSSAGRKPKTEDDEVLEQLTEEELAKLLEDTGLDRVAPEARADPLKGVDKAVVFVYEDPAVKAEKKEQEVAELVELIQKIEANAYEVPVSVNLNSNENLTDELLARLGKALATNTIITELQMANCAIGSVGAVALIEGLKHNKTLTNFNLESNMIGGPGLEALAEVLIMNNTLKELRVTNQRSTISGKPEREFVKALEKNTSLQKLGFSPKDQTTRNQVDKFIFRNRDLARQARLAESKKK